MFTIIVVVILHLEKRKQVKDPADIRVMLFHKVYAHAENELAIKIHCGKPRNTVIK